MRIFVDIAQESYFLGLQSLFRSTTKITIKCVISSFDYFLDKSYLNFHICCVNIKIRQTSPPTCALSRYSYISQ